MLSKGINEIVINYMAEQKWVFLDFLGVSLHRSLFKVKGVIRAGERIIRAEIYFDAASSLTMFWNSKAFRKWKKFNRIFSRNDVPQEFKAGHGLYIFILFYVEHFLEERKNFNRNSNVLSNIYIVQN